MVQVGKDALDFRLRDASKVLRSLTDFSGKWVILYFYPKDLTPGCTLEAIDFSGLRDDFSKLGAVVLGVSKDSCESHQRFIDKKALTITLLSDPDSKVQKDYGVWRMKKVLGKEFMGTVRTTILIDPEGVIRNIWDNVKVKNHAQDVLDELIALQDGG